MRRKIRRTVANLIQLNCRRCVRHAAYLRMGIARDDVFGAGAEFGS
jgi:hypothetical protein